jgi:hypothetical protein
LNLQDTANFFGQNNSRFVRCVLAPNPDWAGVPVNGADTANPWMTLTINLAIAVNHPFTASLDCGAMTGGTDQSYVYVNSVRISALATDNIQIQ